MSSGSGTTICCTTGLCKRCKDTPDGKKRARAYNTERNKIWRTYNRDVVSRSAIKYRQANYELCLQRQRNYYAKHAETIRAYDRQRNRLRKPQKRMHNAFRRASKRMATPPWVTQSHKLAIKAIYDSCPDGHQVDHIVPLISPIVCGLHVPWNLQILTASANIRKKNKLL